MRGQQFLWFVTDGLSVDYSQELFEFYGDHAVAYGLDVPGAKYSHAIYSSWLSGQVCWVSRRVCESERLCVCVCCLFVCLFVCFCLVLLFAFIPFNVSVLLVVLLSIVLEFL